MEHSCFIERARLNVLEDEELDPSEREQLRKLIERV